MIRASAPPLDALIAMARARRLLVVPNVAPPAPGARGLVDRLGELARIGRSDDERLDPAYLLGATGVAQRVYQFTPDDNHAWRAEHPGAEFDRRSLDVDSFGLVDAISVHAERSIRRYAPDKRAERWALAKHELDDRRLLTVDLQGFDAVAGWVVGYREGETVVQRGNSLVDAVDGDVIEVVFDAILEEPADDEPRITTMWTVRPADAPVPERRRHAVQRAVLGFARRHLRTEKELHHDAEVFVAAGLRAWGVTAELLGERGAAVRANDARRADLVDWLTTWAEDVRAGRMAASTWARAWQTAVAAGDDRWASVDGDAAAFADVSDAWDAAAGALGMSLAALDADDALASDASVDRVLAGFASAQQADARALAALDAADGRPAGAMF